SPPREAPSGGSRPPLAGSGRSIAWYNDRRGRCRMPSRTSPVVQELFVSAPTLTPTGNGQMPPPPIPVFDNSLTFKMACRQLETVANVIDIDPGVLKRLSFPRRALVVSVPVRMDDGRTEVFMAFRVQHSLTSGPAQGGLRYYPGVDLGEVAALAMWMSWKCGIMHLPFGGA